MSRGILRDEPAERRVIPAGIEVIQPSIGVYILPGEESSEVVGSLGSCQASIGSVFAGPDHIPGAVGDLGYAAYLIGRGVVRGALAAARPGLGVDPPEYGGAHVGDCSRQTS